MNHETALPRGRRCLRGLKRFIRFAPSALAALAGCTTLQPPADVRQKGQDAASEEVFVIRTLFHAAIAIPETNETYVEWGFGDRIYMTRAGWVKTARGGLLVPLGVVGRTTGGVLERTKFVPSGDAKVFRASRDKIDVLRSKLEMEYNAGEKVGDTNLYRTVNSNYSFWWYNCQNWLAEQVRDLGAHVSKFRIVPRWGGWAVSEQPAKTGAGHAQTTPGGSAQLAGPARDPAPQPVP